jgi:hypothetical protein
MPRRELRPCGTAAAYQRHRVNGEKPCLVCRLAKCERERAKRVLKPPRELLPCTASRHGATNAAYTAGCRCPEARAAHAEWGRKYRDRVALGASFRIPEFRVRRRLQALMAIGWPTRELAKHMGYAPGQSLFWLYSGVYEQTVDVFERVCDLFDSLCMTPGPSVITRKRAARAGWLPPLAWDDIDDPNEHPVVGIDECVSVDMVAVQRRISGDRSVTLRLAERTVAYRLLYERGLLDAEIARAAGCDSETIGRWRRREGLVSNVLNERRFAS